MTDPTRLIALHTLIGAISEGGDAIIERYRRESPAPDLDAMIAAYRVQISLLLSVIEFPEDNTQSSPHPDYTLAELQLMGLYP